MSALQDLFTNFPLIPLFSLITLFVGFWAYLKSKAHSFEDYAVASRSLPTGALIMTLLGTYLSGSHLSVVDRFISFGVIHIFSSLVAIVSFLFIGTFLAPRLVHFTKERTAASLMGTFYGRSAQLFSALLGIFASVLVLIMQISILAKMSEALLPLDFTTAVLFFGVIVLLYSLWGGLRSVSYTDVLQMVALLLCFGFITHKILHQIGGMATLLEVIQRKYADKLAIFSSPRFYFKLRDAPFFGLPFSFIMSPPIVHRMLVVSDKRVVRQAWYTSALLYGLVTLNMVLISFAFMVGRESLGLHATTDRLVYLVHYLFADHPAVLSLVFIGLSSILLSTIDSFLHTAGIILVEDILAPLSSYLGRPPSSGKGKVGQAKASIGLISLLAILVSTQLQNNDLWMLLTGFSIPAILIYASVNIPLVLGILGVKTHRRSWWAFLWTYFGVIGLCKWLGWRRELYSNNHLYFDYFLLAMPLGIVAYFVVHLYVHGGIVFLEKKPYTTAERLWEPNWQGIRQGFLHWIYTTFHLSRLARIEVAKRRPFQSLSFSLLIFTLYTLGNLFTGTQDEGGLPEFTIVVHAIGVILCLGLLLETFWPTICQPYFALYWFCTLFYCLPLGGAVVFLRMHQSIASMFLFVGSFGLLALLVGSRLFGWMTLWAFLLSHLGWYLLYGELPADVWGANYTGAYFFVALLLLSVLSLVHNAEVSLDNRLYLNKAFSNAVMHEIRQPLTEISFIGFSSDKVSGTLQPMKREGEEGFWFPKEMKRYIEESGHTISESLRQIGGEFSRFQKLLDRDISSEPHDKVSISALLKGCLPNLPKRYKDHVKVYLTSLEEDFEVEVIAPLFGNIMTNLLKNAYVHGGANQMEVRVERATRKLYVKDNGRGISAEVLPRIFELRFTTGGETNSGVGLALTKLILSASGVNISCHSRYGGKGSFTEFIFQFPPL